VPVTRDVALDAVSDLLARQPRASVTFPDGEGVAIAPVRARFVGDQPLVGLPVGGSDLAPLAETSLALAGITSAAVQGRSALERAQGRGCCSSGACRARLG
jgi:hypothetical protein